MTENPVFDGDPIHVGDTEYESVSRKRYNELRHKYYKMRGYRLMGHYDNCYESHYEYLEMERNGLLTKDKPKYDSFGCRIIKPYKRKKLFISIEDPNVAIKKLKKKIKKLKAKVKKLEKKNGLRKN